MTWTQRKTFFHFNTLSQEECSVTMTLCWDHVAQTTIDAKETGFAQKMIHHCLWVRCKLAVRTRRVCDNGSTYYTDMALGVASIWALQLRWFDIDCCQANFGSVWAPCRKLQLVTFYFDFVKPTGTNWKVSNHRRSTVLYSSGLQLRSKNGQLLPSGRKSISRKMKLE